MRDHHHQLGQLPLDFFLYFKRVHKKMIVFVLGKSPGASQIVIKQLEEQLCEKERLMADTTRTWMDRLKMTEQRKLEEVDDLRKAGISLGVENRLPNLVNLNEDPQVSNSFRLTLLIYTHSEIPPS